MGGRFLATIAGTLLWESVGDYSSIVETVNRGGAIAVLVGGVLGLAWISRWLLQQLLRSKDEAIASFRADRDDWRTVAMNGLHLAERGTTIAERRVGLR